MWEDNRIIGDLGTRSFLIPKCVECGDEWYGGDLTKIFKLLDTRKKKLWNYFHLKIPCDLSNEIEKGYLSKKMHCGDMDRVVLEASKKLDKDIPFLRVMSRWHYFSNSSKCCSRSSFFALQVRKTPTTKVLVKFIYNYTWNNYLGFGYFF